MRHRLEEELLTVDPRLARADSLLDPRSRWQDDFEAGPQACPDP